MKTEPDRTRPRKRRVVYFSAERTTCRLFQRASDDVSLESSSSTVGACWSVRLRRGAWNTGEIKNGACERVESLSFPTNSLVAASNWCVGCHQLDIIFFNRDHKHGGVSTIMSEIPYIKLSCRRYHTSSSSCPTILVIKTIPSTNGFGFAFAKGTPIVHDMSIGIMKLREEGEIARMEEKWFRSNQSSVSSPCPDSSNPNVLHFNSFRGLFLISGISSSLALSFFLLFSMKERLIFVKKYYKLEHLRVLRMYIHSKLFHVNEEHSTA